MTKSLDFRALSKGITIMDGFRIIAGCRSCGCEAFLTVLDIGMQALTGVFPAQPGAEVTVGPLELALCSQCGLLQLRHSFDAAEMYGDSYGYRSGLNKTMVDHLEKKALHLTALAGLAPGDTVLDIGSNDGTLLNAFTIANIVRVGIDPTAGKFERFYHSEIKIIQEFFSSRVYLSQVQTPARLVTSIAMFYDLENPNDFVRQIAEILAPGGLWHFEQSYLPLMLEQNAYDTVCHEHLEYYSLRDVMVLLETNGLTIIDVTLNDVNGGSFAVTACKDPNPSAINAKNIDRLIALEDSLDLTNPDSYLGFRDHVTAHGSELRNLVLSLIAEGKTVAGYGASTKGNVILQHAGLGPEHLVGIAEVNPDKFGCYTPGTNIPIRSEEEIKALLPDYLLVLPWHFRDAIIERERDFLQGGGRLIFPLPEIQIVSASGVSGIL